MQILTKKIWLTLGVSTLLIRAILSAETIERFYSRGFFLHIRNWIDSFVYKIPFPPFYLFWFISFIGIIYCFRHFRGIYSIRRKWLMSILSFANLIGAIIFSFMIYTWPACSFEWEHGHLPNSSLNGTFAEFRFSCGLLPKFDWGNFPNKEIRCFDINIDDAYKTYNILFKNVNSFCR